MVKAGDAVQWDGKEWTISGVDSDAQTALLTPGRLRAVAPIAELVRLDIEPLCGVCGRLELVHDADTGHPFVEDRPPEIMGDCESCDDPTPLSELRLRGVGLKREWVCVHCQQDNCMRAVVAQLLVMRDNGELPPAIDGLDFDEHRVVVYYRSEMSARFRPPMGQQGETWSASIRMDDDRPDPEGRRIETAVPGSCTDPNEIASGIAIALRREPWLR